MERWTSHAVVPMLASGSNGDAPLKPAAGDAHAQLEGMN
jgi:hypothetical protein